MVKITDDNIKDICPGLIVFHKQLGFGKVLACLTDTTPVLLQIILIFAYPSVIINYTECDLFLVKTEELIVKTEDYIQNQGSVIGYLIPDLAEELETSQFDKYRLLPLIDKFQRDD